MTETPAPLGYDPDALLLQQEAADLGGCSFDRIKRARRDGEFPGARTRPGDHRGTWLIPISDLIAAGFVDVAVLATASDVVATARESKQVATLLTDNHRRDAQIAGLKADVARLEGERDWLRSVVATLGQVA